MAKKGEATMTDSDDVVERAQLVKFSLFAGRKLANAPTAATAMPTTKEGKQARYIGMIDQQISYLNEEKESGKAPTTFNKEGKEVKARTWYHKVGNKVFCKIRNGKAYLKFDGFDSVTCEDYDDAISFYEQFKETVMSGEAAQELGLRY